MDIFDTIEEDKRDIFDELESELVEPILPPERPEPMARPRLTGDIPEVGGGIPPQLTEADLAEVHKQSRLGEEIAGTMAEAEVTRRVARVFEPNLPRNLLAPISEEALREGAVFRAANPELDRWNPNPFRPPATVAELSPGTRESLAAGEALSGTLADLSSADQALVLGGAVASGGLPGVTGRILGAAAPATFGVEGAKSITEGVKALLSPDATPEERGQAKVQIGLGASMLPGLGALIKRPVIPSRIVETIARTEAAVPGALSKSKAALEQAVIKEQLKQEVADVINVEQAAAETKTKTDPSQAETAIPREPARGQGGEATEVLLTGPEVIKSIVELPDAAAGSLRQKPAVEAGMKLTEADVPALEAARDSTLKQAVEAAERGDNEAFKAGFGKNIWFAGAIEGARRKGPNYETFIKEQAAQSGIPRQAEPDIAAAGSQREMALANEGNKNTTGNNLEAIRNREAELSRQEMAQQQESSAPVLGGSNTRGAEAGTPSSYGATAGAEVAPIRVRSPQEQQQLGQSTGKSGIDELVNTPATTRAVETASSPVAAEGQPLASAEAKLSQVVNQTIEQSSPTRLGVSPAATMRLTDVVLGAPDLRSISPAVEARWQAAVKGTENIIDKVKTNANEAWKSVTREYADLPPREFPAEIDVLRRLRASRNASARTTVDVLRGITHNMGPNQYGVFNRVALLEDLVKDVEAGKYATGNDLPFGYKDAGELTADLNKFRAVADSTPQIKAALERRQEFMDSMRSTLVERGFLPKSVLKDPRYFHHQVLLYMAEKNSPANSRSFRDWFSGWQKKRTGSSRDYNRQYVEAEAGVLSDAFNKIAMQDLQGEMRGISDLTAELKELHGAEWRQHIPKTHTEWQPKRGNAFYPVQTVAERVMDRYLSGLGDILPSEFKEALAMGGRKQEWVIPKPLAKVLDNIAPRPDNWIGKLATTMDRSWKKYILLNPLRAAKYNLNNLSGDLDFLFAAQPKIFKEFKSSAGDMWGFHVKGKSAAGDIKDAMQDGVIGSGWRSSELPDIARSDYFNWLTGEKPKLVDRYWNWIGKRNDAREDTGRLASYRYAKKEWEAGRPFYGASVPADVNALATPRLKAAKVAREILIDYGRGTEFSNFTRQKLVPFFKWMEGNFVRYQQLIKNLPTQEGGEARLAGATAKKTATLGLRLGAAYGIVNLWNHMFFPQEEEELGEGRNQLHLILGRDDQGNVQTIRFQGALSDLLGWVGMENLPQDVEDLATGKADVGDKMQDAYEAGLGRAVNASLPFAKTAAEIGLERSFYPNALQPRPVRDKAEHAAGLFSLKPVYQWLAGKPHKPLRQEIANLITYTTDPGEAAYNTTRHMAGEWLEEHGEERANVIPGKKSNALYYYKQALRYKDQATAQKFLDEYNRLGGSREGLTQSIKASAPLSMLGKQRGAFLDSLSPQEQEAVKRAEEWYRKVYER